MRETNMNADGILNALEHALEVGGMADTQAAHDAASNAVERHLAALPLAPGYTTWHRSRALSLCGVPVEY